jgi:hypothetical protein
MALVATRFIARHLMPPARSGLAPLDDLAERHFKAVVHGQHVPLDVLRKKVSTAPSQEVPLIDGGIAQG